MKWKSKFSAACLLFIGTLACLVFVVLSGAEVAYWFEHGKSHFLEINLSSQITNGARTALNDQYRQRIPLTPAPEYYRILTIGGSTTYGQGVTEHETWSKRVQETFRSTGQRVQVVNLGLLGGNLREQILNTNSMQVERFLPERFIFERDEVIPTPVKESWKNLRPQLVLLAPQVNELAPTLYYKRLRQNSHSLFNLTRFLLQQSYLRPFALYHYLKRAHYKYMERIDLKVLSEEEIVSELSLAARAMEANLTKLVDMWKKDSEVVLIQFPLLFRAEDGQSEIQVAQRVLGLSQNLQELEFQKDILTFTEYADTKIIQKVAKTMGLKYFCLFCEVKSAKISERLKYFVDPIHLNAKGHERVAQELALSLEDMIQMTEDFPESKKLAERH